MSGGKLSALQWRILEELAGWDRSWTLTGGAALAGVHLQHRTTRDLDLFWQGRNQLGSLPADVRSRLEAAGLEVAVLQSATTFSRLRVNDGTDTGFSPLTLAWVLKGFPLRALARAAGVSDDDAQSLEHFKEELIQRLLHTSTPADPH